MNKTLLQIIQQASQELGQPVPQQVIASTNATTQQMLALTVQLCDELLQAYDWEDLINTWIFMTIPGLPAYAKPVDFYKLLNGTMWDQTNHWPILGPKTPSEWAWLKGGYFNGGPRTRFRFQGNLITFTPIYESVNTIYFDYMCSYYVLDGSTYSNKPAFQYDSDLFVFDDRLVINGLKLKFRESKGLDTTVALSDFNTSLDAVQGADNAAPTLSISPIGYDPYISTNNLPSTGYGHGS